MRTSGTLKNLLVVLTTLLVGSAVARGDDGGKASSEKEKQLLAVLRSDAPAGEKALTCKRLAIHGSSASVPELARLLPDPRLSSWARIALEAIPGKAADKALRQALDSLEGKLLIGTINSIGVRRDAAAVSPLVERLRHKDAEVASAAAVALGKIGDTAATKALRQALAGSADAVRSAVAEACVLCAERLHNNGKPAEAVELYDEIRTAQKIPQQRMIEATRGAILARGEKGIPLLLEQLRSPDKKLFRLGLGTAREFSGGALDQALAKELNRAAPARAALIIVVMADRPETVVRPALLKAAAKGPSAVRLAALEALGRVGDASALATLLEAAADDDRDLSNTARQALASLSGDGVNKEIAARLPQARGKSYALLIELVGQRRIPDAVPQLLKALDHSEAGVRAAALAALGETIDLERLPVLIMQAISAKNRQDAAAAQEALRAASVRMPDREACATQLTAALKRTATRKSMLLEILADVGGAKSLKTLAEASKSSDAQLQDTASRLLGKWNGVDAAPVLLDLAKTAPQGKYRIRALRGYIGLARKFAMPEPKRAAMLQNALNAATRAAEQKLVLDVLKIRPSAAGLRLAVKATRNPALKEAATAATLVIAQKIGGKKTNVGPLLAAAGLERIKLQIIKAQYGAGSTQKDVTALLRKHAGNLPFIKLPTTSYNASFGGDPVPGTVKKLTIEYRINGKLGKASFAENALIILPMPK